MNKKQLTFFIASGRLIVWFTNCEDEKYFPTGSHANSANLFGASCTKLIPRSYLTFNGVDS